MRQVDLDIIIPTHGRVFDLTVPCLTLIYEHTRAPFHLIVVDDSTPDLPSGQDGVPDDTLKHIQRLQIEKDNVTFYHSITPFKCGNEIFNVGLSLGNAPVVATIMNSTQVEPDWDIVAMKMFKEWPKVGAIGLKCLKWGWGEKEDGQIECAGIQLAPDGFSPSDMGRNEPGHRRASTYPVWGLQWAFAMFRREAIEGNLDENLYQGFVGWDDIDNTLVVRSKGWEAWYCGLGVGYHRTHATRGSASNDALLKNLINGEIFYKRWGLWEKFKARHPYAQERFPTGVKFIADASSMPLTLGDIPDTGVLKVREEKQ